MSHHHWFPVMRIVTASSSTRKRLRCETKLNPVSTRTVTPVAAARPATTKFVRRSPAGSTASGSARGGPRRMSATTSAIMTATKIAVSTAVNIQNSQASSRACGPCGSSADCHPRQPARARARTESRSAVRAFIAASLRRLTRGRRVAAGHGREGRGAVLGRARMHVVVARGRRVLRHVAAHRAHIAGDLPDLVVRDLAAERRHAVRPALADRVDDVLDRAAVDPDIVDQRRPGAAAAIGVAADAVEPAVERLALGEVVGVALELLALAADLARRAGRAWEQRHERDLLLALGRGGAEAALLALAAGKRQRRQGEDAERLHWTAPTRVGGSARGTP